MARKPRAAKEAPRAESGTPDKDEPTADEIALVKRCGLVGCNSIETEAKLGRAIDSESLITAYQQGRADHAYSVMSAIYKGAIQDGKEKLLLWLAENNLKRNMDAKIGDAIIDAMTPEQRRDKIRELTEKLTAGNMK